MQSRAILAFAAALLATAVSCMPHPEPAPLLTIDLDLVSLASNCTQYCSDAAGCVCTVRPSDCTALYLVQPDDNCNSIAAIYNNFTVSQFYLWNPDIGKTCFGLQAYVPVCINTPWYVFAPPVQSAYGSVKTPEEVPVPQMPGIVSDCALFEYVAPGTRVDALAQEYGITVDQLAQWNGDATSLWENYWVCVQA